MLRNYKLMATIIIEGYPEKSVTPYPTIFRAMLAVSVRSIPKSGLAPNQKADSRVRIFTSTTLALRVNLLRLYNAVIITCVNQFF